MIQVMVNWPIAHEPAMNFVIQFWIFMGIVIALNAVWKKRAMK